MRQMFKVVMAAVLVALLSWGIVARSFAQEGAGRPFITKWQGAAGEYLKIPIVGTDYKLVIKDAQGNVVKSEEKVTVEGTDASYYHAFTPTADGVYTVEAGPEGVKAMQMRAEWESEKYEWLPLTSNAQLLEVVQFGTVAWESMYQMFYRCENMTFAANIDTPDLTKVTNMSEMFWGCSSFNQPLEKWNVSQVTDMSWMLSGCSAFNQPLEKWDMSQVTNMNGMFSNCTAFNQPLEKWDVSQVTSMKWMFNICSAFNQPLEKWNVSQVTDMYEMFRGCSAFNQPLEKWTVSQVTDMGDMLSGCSTFNQPLEKWDVSNVRRMSGMFYGCSAFNQPLKKWNVSKVTYMSSMFSGCTTFNQPLEKWDVSNVRNMEAMFAGCSSFNQPLEKWNVSQVTRMIEMFRGCTAFNQPLEKWDVRDVTYMDAIFYGCTAFNQPLEKWNVSQVTRMIEMFRGCTAFNQPLEKWDVRDVTYMDEMFAECKSFNQPLGAWELRTAIGGLSTTSMSAVNYSLSLIGWAEQTDGASYIRFRDGVSGLIYNDAGKEAREKLIARGWTFKGDVYKPSEKVAISLAQEGEGTLAIEGYNDDALKTVEVCTELTVIATPKEGYTLTALTAGTQDILATRKFTVTESVEVKAVFKEIEKVAISLAKEGEGTLAIEGYNDDALKAVAVGTELTVIATPKDGYSLTSLIAGTQDILATRKFTVTEAVTVKAVFTKNGGSNPGGGSTTFAVTLAKEGEGTLAIEGYNDDALKAVAVGTELTVIATPKEGYKLTSLSAGTQDILATKKFTVTEAVTVKAVFTKNGGSNPGGGSTTFAVTLAKEGEGTLAIEGYNDETLQAVAEGTELTVIATPKEGYTLTSLMAGTQDILATKKFTVTGAVTVKAVFTKNGGSNPGGGSTTFAVTLVKEGEGTLAIEGYNDETLQTVAEGTELTVIATPKEGYTLTALTAGTQDILATKKFTVTEAVTVKAVFKKKGNNGGGNGGGGWQPQTPQAVEDVVLASLAVAPNPFTAQLRIDNPEGVAGRYELVNATGVVVRFGAFSATEVLVDTEALPAGLYLVHLMGQNGAKRVVKVSKC